MPDTPTGFHTHDTPLSRDSNDVFKGAYVVRQCIVLLLWHLLLVQILCWIGDLGLHTLPQLIPRTGDFISTYMIIFSTLINLGEILWLGYFILSWDCNYYLITPDKIIFRSGIIAKNQETCAIRNIESVDFHQSIIGRIFGFGTIKLFAPTLNHILHMDNIHHPERKMLLIERLLPNTNTSGDRNQRDLLIIPRTKKYLASA